MQLSASVPLMDTLTTEERVAVARLRALVELLPTALDRQLSSADVNSFEFTLLEALHSADLGRLRLTALASRTNATLPRLSRVVTSLERKGLVTRSACEEDGRATNAVLTKAGEETYLQVRPVYEDAVKAMVLGNLDSESVGQLAKISYAVLTGLDPERRLAVTSADAREECAADPLPASEMSRAG